MTSRQYRNYERIDYLADLVGADVAADVLKVRLVDEDQVLRIESDSALDASGAVVSVQEDSSLDVSGSVVSIQEDSPIDVADRDGRNLGDVDVLTLPTEDSDELDQVTLSASGTVEMSLQATGATSLQGVVVSSGQYTVETVYETSTGTEIQRVDVATNASGGQATQIDLSALSYDVRIVITETSGSDQTVSGVAHLG